ncbi:hypothetical protein PHYBLDRAFT_159960 [Phycomyces blakesleeanus NRRL 1555(-)]|uniref:Uncharacterized protein n=1 Tax=Phycomyces blakesleeanus (strain ATCC 8743b / DSM 1359 / FGSC 10004 / NBRC 33097 / NRRL 1555) TaxID=763407 RepID=A0A162TIJ5_PHYB8|nr:hypothetical protein PHYBLDRAFT_159960 [Phycomyces blakesleeanus NRRL 1555(-)]OAD68872.1 hypothetical protein PHYBLDRAFT_159960 [Phycomyces blakesleeanus NRRL 1555(-)]|eukprot:XP_018286912.1 hypothetical protein PHYBLDRAFT_159960 [Phycomyces blakesleeanus NRRL 1555(-)]
MSLSSVPTTPFMKDMEDIRASSGPKWSTSGPMTPLTHSMHYPSPATPQIPGAISLASTLGQPQALSGAINKPTPPLDFTNQQFPQRPLPFATPRYEEDTGPLPMTNNVRETDISSIQNEPQQNQYASVQLMQSVQPVQPTQQQQQKQQQKQQQQQEYPAFIQDIIRLKEENDRLRSFKQDVSDVFCALNFDLGGIEPKPSNIEEIVSGLKRMLLRNKPVSDGEKEKFIKIADSIVE